MRTFQRVADRIPGVQGSGSIASAAHINELQEALEADYNDPVGDDSGTLPELLQTFIRDAPYAIRPEDYGEVYTDGTTDNQDVFEAAIAAIPPVPLDGYNRGGAVLEFPAGHLLHTGPLVMPRGATFRGQGMTATYLWSMHTGNGIESHEAVNGSYAVYRRVENMAIANGNASNTGAAFDEICGSFVTLHQVNTRGFKRGIVFDQTEVSSIHECDIEAPLDVGLWLVNSDDHAVGALGEFTNRIKVSSCNFNAGGSVDLVVDDGGYAHTLDDCNFNGGRYQIRAAAVRSLLVSSGEFESMTENPLYFTATTRDSGNGVGQCVVTLLSNIVATGVAGKTAVNAPSVGKLISIGNTYASGPTTAFGDLSGCSTFVSLGDAMSSTNMFTSPATSTFTFHGNGTQGSGRATNPDTSGATLAELEAEVNQLKATLRYFGQVGT